MPMEFPQDMGSDWRKESTSSSASNGSGNDSRPNKHNPEYPKGQSRTIYLPAERTGAVIGKNGRMKHLIKEVCNVWMSIKSEPFEHDVTKRVCVIRGPTVDNLDHAESLIKELLRERETTEKSIALNTSDDVGRVIGSGGSNIQVIKDKTGAFVYVDKENVPAQYAGKCIIRGNSVQVQAAEKRVLELLARRDNLLEQVGLHRNMQQAPQASLPIHKPTGSAHNYNETIGNNSGYSGMKPDHNGNYFDSAKTNDDTKIGVWNSSSPDTTWNSRETERELVKQSKKRIQDNILIPLNAVGMVIGKKGKNIKIIQETSGANVYIDKEYTGHTDSNALCVICGKSEQVEIAKEMIYEKLNQYNTSNSFPILDPQGSIIGTPPSDARSDGSSGLNYHSPLSRSFNSISPPSSNQTQFAFPPPTPSSSAAFYQPASPSTPLHHHSTPSPQHLSPLKPQHLHPHQQHHQHHHPQAPHQQAPAMQPPRPQHYQQQQQPDHQSYNQPNTNFHNAANNHFDNQNHVFNNLQNNQRPRQLQLQQPSPTHQQQRSYPNQESLSPRYQNHAAIMNSHPNMAMSNAMPQPPPPIKTPEEPHSPDELGLNKLSLNILDNNNDSSNSSWLDSDAFIKTDMFLPPPTRGHQLFDMDTKHNFMNFTSI